MTHFKATIIWSDEDQCFVAKVPDLPGCWPLTNLDKKLKLAVLRGQTS